jgi:hypothetical protein
LNEGNIMDDEQVDVNVDREELRLQALIQGAGLAEPFATVQARHHRDQLAGGARAADLARRIIKEADPRWRIAASSFVDEVLTEQEAESHPLVQQFLRKRAERAAAVPNPLAQDDGKNPLTRGR